MDPFLIRLYWCAGAVFFVSLTVILWLRRRLITDRLALPALIALAVYETILVSGAGLLLGAYLQYNEKDNMVSNALPLMPVILVIAAPVLATIGFLGFWIIPGAKQKRLTRAKGNVIIKRVHIANAVAGVLCFIVGLTQ